MYSTMTELGTGALATPTTGSTYPITYSNATYDATTTIAPCQNGWDR